jgi:hypothetical protein
VQLRRERWLQRRRCIGDEHRVFLWLWARLCRSGSHQVPSRQRRHLRPRGRVLGRVWHA